MLVAQAVNKRRHVLMSRVRLCCALGFFSSQQWVLIKVPLIGATLLSFYPRKKKTVLRGVNKSLLMEHTKHISILDIPL